MYGPILRGALVTLRPPRLEEAKAIIEWFADLEVTRYLGRRSPMALHEEEEWLRKVAEDRSTVFWMIEVEGKAVGTIGIHQIDWVSAHGTTGIGIGERSYWRRGVATEAMALRTRYAFQELNLHKLKTEAFTENTASIRALQKTGYRQVGILREERWSDGTWHDTWLGEVLRSEWEREHERR